MHTVFRYGLPSETFIRDLLAVVETQGWENWVAARGIEDLSSSPLAPERIRVPSDPPPLAPRVAARLVPGFTGRRMRARHGYLQLAREIRPDVIHAHFGWTGVDAVLAARRLDVPLLVSFHGTDLTVDAWQPHWRPYYERLLKAADRVTVVSRFLEDKLRALGYEDNVDVLPAGVDPERFAFRGPRQADERMRLLFVGRLIECKGLDVLLHALAIVRRAEPGVSLEVIGDGPTREVAEQLTDSLGLCDAVEFRGAQSHEQVSRALGRSDVLVAPSRTMPNGQAEGSPVVTKEALAVGVPVVATDAGGLPETLPVECRRRIVPEGDSEGLAAEVTRLWCDAQLRHEVSERGRRWVLEQFDLRRLGERTAAIYEALATTVPQVRAACAHHEQTPRPSVRIWGR